MKSYFLFFVFFLIGCSFDNKTGIWKNESISEKDYKNLDGLIEINQVFDVSPFDKNINIENDFIFNISKPIDNLSWNDIYYSKTNNFENFKFNKSYNEIFKSKKLSRSENSKFPLFKNNNFIFSDNKGNIIFFSIKEKNVIKKFNFYKKNYKSHIEKKLNLFIENNILFISDNLGYLYAYDMGSNKILWAIDHKIPFRSNLKIKNGKIYTSNQNNDFLVFNKKNGKIIKTIPTEENKIQNSFINNVAEDNFNNFFFLNSYGSLYSIDVNSLQVNWFINLSSSFNFNPLNIFSSNIVVYQNKKIIISTDSHTYVINSTDGSIISKLNFSSVVRPIINKNYLFIINKNNFLIAYDLIDKKLLYSYNIDNQIADKLKIKKQKISLKDFMLVQDEFLILLNNSYILNFDIRGKLQEIRELNSRISSKPIFINSSLLYLDKKNRLIILN